MKVFRLIGNSKKAIPAGRQEYLTFPLGEGGLRGIEFKKSFIFMNQIL